MLCTAGGKLNHSENCRAPQLPPPATLEQAVANWGAYSGGEEGSYSGGLVCSPVEVGNGADLSRFQTFHPLPLAQTMPCESALQLVAVATHHSIAPAISMRAMPPPSPLSDPG